MPGTTTKRALIVEDESSIRNVCERVLGSIGFDVSIAEDGKLAEEKIEDNFFDLILCDIRLPEVSGIDFYVFLQQEYSSQAKKVIFMTGSVMSSDTANFLEKSGRPYILKPFRPSELLEVINSHAN
jgi:DNA-binding response OmpR family regulator